MQKNDRSGDDMQHDSVSKKTFSSHSETFFLISLHSSVIHCCITETETQAWNVTHMWLKKYCGCLDSDYVSGISGFYEYVSSNTDSFKSVVCFLGIAHLWWCVTEWHMWVWFWFQADLWIGLNSCCCSIENLNFPELMSCSSYFAQSINYFVCMFVFVSYSSTDYSVTIIHDSQSTYFAQISMYCLSVTWSRNYPEIFM